VHCSHHHFIGCLGATSMLIGGSHYQCIVSPSFHWLLGGDINADWRKSLSVHCSHHHFIGCLAATSMLIG